jgi:hypothetical protein
VAFFAVAFFAVAFFAVAFFACTVHSSLRGSPLVSLITSFKNASGKRQLKEARSGSSRVAVTAGRKRSR